MPKWIVQRPARVWYQITVEAANRDEAELVAANDFAEEWADAIEVSDSFDWCENSDSDLWVEEVTND